MSAYKNTNRIKEEHGCPIYCIAFNFLSLQHTDVFASVGSYKASVYRCKPDGEIELIQAYVDANKQEEFYVCKWTIDTDTGAPLLLLAGKTAAVRVINCHSEALEQTFLGHGGAINDIAVHYKRPYLFVTASQDMSLRLWNLKTRVCILILSGEEGHRNEVLTVDFHPSDENRFVSAGMDNTIKIWSIKDHQPLVQQSIDWQVGAISFPTLQLRYPVFSSHKVHFAYVDCVKWLGDCLLSKSVDNKVLLWRPDADPANAERGFVHMVQEYEMEDAKVWWVRFSLDVHCSLLACGNHSGRCFLWRPHERRKEARYKLRRPPGPKSTVRQTALSYDGTTVLFSCDDGTIWRFDQVNAESGDDASHSAGLSDGEEDEEESEEEREEGGEEDGGADEISSGSEPIQ